jgi:hypothetical protein
MATTAATTAGAALDTKQIDGVVGGGTVIVTSKPETLQT